MRGWGKYAAAMLMPWELVFSEIWQSFPAFPHTLLPPYLFLSSHVCKRTVLPWLFPSICPGISQGCWWENLGLCSSFVIVFLGGGHSHVLYFQVLNFQFPPAMQEHHNRISRQYFQEWASHTLISMDLHLKLLWLLHFYFKLIPVSSLLPTQTHLLLSTPKVCSSYT